MPRPDGPLASILRDHFGGGANYDDGHVPAPVERYTPVTTMELQGGRLAVHESGGANGAVIVTDTTVEVRQ